jgi:hypothetical protein
MAGSDISPPPPSESQAVKVNDDRHNHKPARA